MTDDKSEIIIRKIVDKFTEEAEQEGTPVYGFRIYPKIPRREPLFYPCIVIIRGTEEEAEEYLGGGSMTNLGVVLQLAIKEKSALQDDVDLSEDEVMLMKYRDYLDDIFESLFIDGDIPEVNLGLCGNSFTLRVPGPDSPIFGVEMMMQVSYEDD